MTGLQLTGIIAGVVLLVWILIMHRKGHTRGMDIFVGLLGACGLLAVSVFPELATGLRDFLALEKDQFSRLIAVTIVSNILLWFFLVYSRGRLGRQSEDFEKLVQSLALSEFSNKYPEVKKLAPICVVIPSYNESKNIGSVLSQMPKTIYNKKVDVIVVDDGSTDKTQKIVQNAGCYLIQLPLNRGGGAAIRTGFEACKRYSAEIAVTIDADGQHLPQEIEGLIKPIIEDKADFVIGSRMLGQFEKDSSVRLMGIHIFNTVIKMLTPVKVTDCSNGMRALRVESLARLKLRQNQYHTPEVIIQAVRHDLRITEAPITVNKRLSGESKKGKNLYYGFGFARSIFKTWWK